MTRILFFFFIPIFLFATDPYPIDKRIDVQHYKFTLDVYPSEKRLEGLAEIQIKFKEEGVINFAIDLDDPNTDGSGMLVSNVTSSHGPITFEQKDDRLLLNFASAVQKDASILVTVSYAGVPYDGLIMKENKYNETTTFGDNWPNRAQHWLPVVDHPSDKATVEWVVSAPKGYTIVGNGKLLSNSVGKSKRTTTHWKNEVPIPTKVMVVGLADFEMQETGKVGNILITTWAYRKNAKAAFTDFAVAPQVLATLESYIGEYPYEKLAHIQSTTRYGGMENAGNIFYDENAITGARKIDRLIAHETAHMWFGNSVSEKDWHHIWLSEGFATYMTMIYVEQAMGKDSMRADLGKARNTIIKYQERKPNSSTIDTTIVELTQLLSANTYEKGAWFLHMLRQKMGDEAFQKSIRQYYAKYRDTNALTDDFRAIAEAIHGSTLKPFFDQWLYRPGMPEIEWKWAVSAQANNRINIALRQIQPLRYDDIYLDIDVYVKDKQSPIRKNIEVLYNTKEISMMVPSEVEKIVLDPDKKLLFKEKQVTYDR